MHAIRWMIILLMCVVLSFGSTFYTLAAPMQQTDLPLDITITTAQAEATVGAPMTWRIVLIPRGQHSIESIELHPGDTQAWAWPNGSQVIDALTTTIVLEVSAIPLVSGDLTPIIETRYTVAGKEEAQLVKADTSIQVEPVETYIEASLITNRGTVRKGERVPLELLIRNSSPFTLTQVKIQGSSIDLAWGAPTVLKDIPPGEFRWSLTPTVEGQQPQPQISIQYAWTDVIGTSYNRTLYVSGETMAFEGGLIDRIPTEAFGILIGVVAGVLTTFFTGLAGAWGSRIVQKRVNRRHVHGLLRLLILQSEHAADNGVEVDLGPLETIFREEGLFAILEKDKLAEKARNLWKTAERHNTGLNRPGGAQRSLELRQAARELTQKLDISGSDNSGKVKVS